MDSPHPPHRGTSGSLQNMLSAQAGNLMYNKFTLLCLGLFKLLHSQLCDILSVVTKRQKILIACLLFFARARQTSGTEQTSIPLTQGTSLIVHALIHTHTLAYTVCTIIKKHYLYSREGISRIVSLVAT